MNFSLSPKFYDQRSTGLSPRVDEKYLTLEQNLDDLNAIVEHFSNGGKVKLIGHSWGGMLIIAYLSKYPEKVSQAVAVEPGMLYPESAKAYVKIMNNSRSIADAFALAEYIFMYPFISTNDGHEGYDYVMTRLLNRNKPGSPYQCAGHAMPADIFKRAGYEAFNNMMKPVMNAPGTFTYDLTNGISKYRGDLLLISSECSAIGYSRSLFALLIISAALAAWLLTLFRIPLPYDFTTLNITAALGGIFVFAGIEELLFRQVMFRWLEQRNIPGRAVVIATALAYGGGHLGPVVYGNTIGPAFYLLQSLFLVWIGVLLGELRNTTGSWLMPWLGHFCYNVLVLYLLSVAH